jgi:amidohydrolase
MRISDELLHSLIHFRKNLHKFPELSKNEYETAKKIKEFVSGNQPVEIIEGLGGTGLAVVFRGKNPGKTVLIRADIDALPIEELNETIDYRSVNHGVAHLCGHDGHSTIVAGLSSVLSQNPPENGNVVLLFQPAEETGEGAALVLNDPAFADISPDYVFALHNLPGFVKAGIVVRDEHFAAASKGMIIRLTGKTSHAANPEHGISPAMAVAQIIQQLTQLSADGRGFYAFKLVTIIYTKIGEIAFGTTPGYAEVMATLRSYRNDDMDVLTNKAIKIVEEAADFYGLQEKIEWREEFPATINQTGCSEVVKEVAKANGFEMIIPEQPFRWSEDFGHFTMKYPGALFGVGSGKKHPALHNPDYDFPDDIIKPSITMFYGIIKKLIG